MFKKLFVLTAVMLALAISPSFADTEPEDTKQDPFTGLDEGTFYEGEWNVTFKVYYQGVILVKTYKQAQCLTLEKFIPTLDLSKEKDLGKDFGEELGEDIEVKTPADKNALISNCELNDLEINGNNVSWLFKCEFKTIKEDGSSETISQEGSSELTFSDQTKLKGTTKVKMALKKINAEGKVTGTNKISLVTRVKGEYIGECNL